MTNVLNPRLKLDRNSLFITIGLIGTTIAPWMQFYQQAAIVEKGIKLKNYAYSRLDTIIGGILVSIVASFILYFIVSGKK
jgi:Mn2+/Fe2+ NRAMP family transporter